MKNVKNKKPAKATKSGYPRETELESKSGGDENYSEQNDVPAMPKREFPSVGNAETDFVSRRTGRHTGRMVGHEPGTESL
ncbi:MAG: hypothetical protein ACTHNW_08135 [Mucilaginibacter sp.]